MFHLPIDWPQQFWPQQFSSTIVDKKISSTIVDKKIHLQLYLNNFDLNNFDLNNFVDKKFSSTIVDNKFSSAIDVRFLKSCDLKLDTWDTDYMWHLRHWLHCWQLRTTLLRITLWSWIALRQGQHSQFLRCFGLLFYFWRFPHCNPNVKVKGWCNRSNIEI